MSQSDDLLTSTQAGKILGKSRKTVTRLAHQGILTPVTQLPGPNGSMLFRRGDVEALASA